MFFLSLLKRRWWAVVDIIDYFFNWHVCVHLTLYFHLEEDNFVYSMLRLVLLLSYYKRITKLNNETEDMLHTVSEKITVSHVTFIYPGLYDFNQSRLGTSTGDLKVKVILY